MPYGFETLSPADAAQRLRAVADRLEADCETKLEVRVTLDVSRFAIADQATRVAFVDTLAALLGLTAEPRKLTESYWKYEARDEHDGFAVNVCTEIATPRRCACGAECTHTPSTTDAGQLSGVAL